MNRRNFILGSAAALVAAPIAVEAKLSLANDIKPFVVGRVYNIVPMKIDPKGYIYRFTLSPDDVTLEAVYHGGEPLKYFGDGKPREVPLVPPAGHYSTCRELGMFVIHEPPTKPLLVDLLCKQ
jgi:hypothetical protein